MVSTVDCNLCSSGVTQDIFHLFIQCQYAQKVWRVIKELLIHVEGLNWDTHRILSNTIHDNYKHIANFLTLVAKYYIFRNKCLETPLAHDKVKTDILMYYRIELANHPPSKMTIFHRRWGCLESFLRANGHKI